MEQIVIGCKDCPFYNDGVRYEYVHYCNHPNSPQEVSTFTAEPKIELYSVQEEFKNKNYGDYYTAIYPTTPDWCPLNKEPITITKQ